MLQKLLAQSFNSDAARAWREERNTQEITFNWKRKFLHEKVDLPEVLWTGDSSMTPEQEHRVSLLIKEGCTVWSAVQRKNGAGAMVLHGNGRWILVFEDGQMTFGISPIFLKKWPKLLHRGIRMEPKKSLAKIPVQKPAKQNREPQVTTFIVHRY